MSFPNFFEAVDYRQLVTDYPLGGDFVERYAHIDRDALRGIQEARFRSVVQNRISPSRPTSP